MPSKDQKDQPDHPTTAGSATTSPSTLGLPAPGSEGQTTQLDLSSGQDTVSLDHLGPLVVNVDGTMSRITNWAEMSEIEQKTTLRVLGKRNKARLDALKAQEGK